MTSFIPKEKLTAYQRWEVAAFDEAEQAAAQKSAEHASEPAIEAGNDIPANDEPPVVLPTAAEIEQMHIEAHEQGYAAGYEEGIEKARAVTAKLDDLMSSLQQSLAAIDQEIADQLLATAVEIASQVVRQSLRVKPDLLLPVVREAITTLHPHLGHPALFAHPDDAALIRTHLGEQLSHLNWRIIEDASITAGGCRVELGASEIDATLETRWRRVIEAIGINQEWLNDKP
jgi:flagellar assembly protein FliH